MLREHFEHASGSVIYRLAKAKIKATETTKLRPLDPVLDLRYLRLRAACLCAQQRLKPAPADPVKRTEHNKLRAKLRQNSRGLKRQQ